MNLETVFTRNRARILGLAAKTVGTNDAEDVYQDAVMGALAVSAGLVFENDKHADCWFYSVALNTCRDRMRYAGRECRSGTVVLSPEMEQTLQGKAQDSDEVRAVRKAMDTLPKEDGEVLTKFYYENKSHKMIGADLGISEVAARLRVHRATKALRKIMKGDAD